MSRLVVFNSVSLDGYFTDRNGDMSWAHKNDPEWNEFVGGNVKNDGGVLLFGRITYEMMAGYWPTPQALKNDPVVAKAMNGFSKVVFSRKLEKATWSNTRLVKDGMAAEVRRLKSESGGGLVILGSGTIVAQLAREGLVDEYQMIVNPIVLGEGRTLFEGVEKPIALELANTRSFKNGNVLLSYVPVR